MALGKKEKTTDVVSVQDELRKELDTLKERVDPPSGFMISTKGKTFTLPDGSANPGPLDGLYALGRI